MVRALNLDENEISVQIGGRGFVLTQQAKVPLMRVLDAIYESEKNDPETDSDESATGSDEPEEKKTAKDENLAQMFIEEWDKAIPVFALMFGFKPEKEDEWTEVVGFLFENLAPMSGVKIFHAWWELNEVDDFFIRCGRTLLHPLVEQSIRTQMQSMALEQFQDAVEEIREATQSG